MADPASSLSPRDTRRVVVFNDTPATLSAIGDCCSSRGHRVVLVQLSHLSGVVCVSIESLLARHTPDVVVFDVPIPYDVNWDFLAVVRLMPAMAGVSMVVTTANKVVMDRHLGKTEAIEVNEGSDEVEGLMAAIAAAPRRVAARRDRTLN